MAYKDQKACPLHLLQGAAAYTELATTEADLHASLEEAEGLRRELHAGEEACHYMRLRYTPDCVPHAFRSVFIPCKTTFVLELRPGPLKQIAGLGE